MTIVAVTSITIPQVKLTAAINHLNSLGFMASELKPEESATELHVSYMVPKRETPMQSFTRSEHETRSFRVWAATDGSTRITEDAASQENIYTGLDEALSALAAIATKPGKVA